jgi:YggT family protein
MILPLAIDRADVADFVYTLALVFVILIFIRVIMSFIPRIPYYRWLDAFLNFVTQVTDPILNVFRRFIPPIRIGGGALDLTPMIATFVLLVLAELVAGLIR